MSNRYRDKELTPMEVAAIEHAIDRMNNGIWESETDMKAALRHPGYSVDGRIGELYRHAWEAKGLRTAAAGFDVSCGNKAYDSRGSAGVRAATARHDADGNIVAKEVPWYEQGNNIPTDGPARGDENLAPTDESGGRFGEGVTVIHRGNTTQVSVSRIDTLNVPRSNAERAAREKYLREANAKKQRSPLQEWSDMKIVPHPDNPHFKDEK